MQRLTQAIDFQAQALGLRAERQRLIASNIANADTPGYQAREMDFSKALREATGQQAGSTASLQAASGTLAATNAGHLSTAGGARGDDQLLYATSAQNNLDRNTVDLDRERAAFADNSIKYEATLRFINGSVRSMLDAMKSANQG
ncbi:MAG: flagellar basal body rod protein FlgB [Burkholderiales bacterium]|nr:flagellar basal body rod protein FlgB [Burkholderiales bacterium]